jgi:hypothetical protein
MTGCSIIPLKRLADTYHVSILAVHHLRKTSSSDVLDEITGSIGMTGAVDGTLILKRERGQTEATLFVTGRDIEREQQLALSFDATQALWSVIGDSEEVGRTRARQEIIELLREQQEGMSPREIAEALKKNYHTTRSILRKMEGMGEIAHLQGRYLTLSMKRSPEQVQLTKGNGHIKHIQHHQRREQAASIEERCDGHTGTHQSDASDYVDYAAAADDTNGLPVAPFDYTDYADATDYGIDTSVKSVTSEGPLNGVANVEEGMASIPLCTDRALLQEVDHQQEPARITVINRNQCNQLPASERPVEVQGVPHNEANQGAATVTGEATPPNNRCPHHPRARMVRFDPAGQAWCDRLDCWDCYRLMKIGEVLGYRRLTERGGKLLLAEGMEAWATYVRTQRAFLIAWATQEALALCRALGILEPDLSGEVKRLMEVQPLPP